MILKTPNCPQTTDDLRTHLSSVLKDFDAEDTIEFCQWTTTDRSNLISCKETMNDYIDIIEEQLQKLTTHSYIAKSQSRYLKFRKENLEQSEALSLGNFAENYKFVVQDKVQGFHWTNLQCTLHPVVVYFKDGLKVCHKSCCFITDDNCHDVATVHQVQELVINDLKLAIKDLKSIEYFSDGCAGQYKNRSLTAKWSFFAMSHGKQPDRTHECTAEKNER